MRKWILIVLLLLGLTSLPIIALAQSDMPFDITDARLNGLTLPEGTRYVFILPYNSADAVYDLSVTVNLPLGVQLISAQQANGVIFSGVSQNATHTQLFWRANEILSGDLFAPFAFTLNTPVNDVVDVTITWADSIGEMRSEQVLLYPNTLNAVEGGASFNAEAPIPAQQFTFIGDTGVVIYSTQELPAGAITVREAPSEENPPAELGDFWWCSGLDLQGASGVTVYVPLRKPLPPLMPLTLFALVNGAWQALDVQGYVSADGLYAVYDHPGGLIFTGTEAENNPTEVPPAPPPPPDSDGDGFTDDVDACPNQGDGGFGLDGAGCPLPPPDSDGDGFPDPNDTCPMQGDAGFGLDGAGCPLQPPPPPPDSDGDGIADPNDSCPNQGDAGFGLGGDGCPLPPPPDTDGDGIPDFSDTCPTEGDLGLGLGGDGCPILPPPDTDGDGIPDPNDACPDQGDLGFGITADGCPLLPTFTPTPEPPTFTPTSEVPAPTDVPTATPTATIPPQPTPFPPELVLFGFSAPNSVFGRTAQAQLAIAEPFPADVRVTIQVIVGGTNISVNVPSEVTIPAGQTIASVPVSPNENKNGFVTLRASLVDNPTSRLTTNLFVLPLSLTSVSINSTRLVAGQTATGTVQIASPAEFDISLAISSNSPDVSVAPVIMPAGATSATFDVRLNPQNTTPQVQISASFGDTAIFGAQTVTSALVPVQTDVAYGITLPTSITSAGGYQGEIVLLGQPLPTNTTVTLTSPRPDVVISPSTATILAGSTRTTFTFTVAESAVFNETVVINGIDNTTGVAFNGSFVLNTLRVRLLRISDSTLNLGGSTTVAVSLNAPVSAPFADVTISLNNADVVADLPVIDAEAGLYNLQIPQGQSGADFTIRPVQTFAEDSTLTVTAILPADTALSQTIPVLANLQVTSFDFGRTPVQPGLITTGRVSLNAPAPRDTVVRLVPADGVAFSTGFPNQVIIPAGSQTADVNITVAGTISTARVGIIAFIDGQTPSQGFTGFFTVAVNAPSIRNVQLRDTILGENALETILFIELEGLATFNANTSLRYDVLVDESLAPMLDNISGLASARVIDGVSNTVMSNPVIEVPIRLNLTGFPRNVTADLLDFPIRVSLSIGGDTIQILDTRDVLLQVRPFLIPSGIRVNNLSDVALDAQAVNSRELIISVIGARASGGGTLRLSSSHPDLVTVPAQIDVPPNTLQVRVPLQFVSANVASGQQNITFSVTGSRDLPPDIRAGTSATLRFVQPFISDISLRQNNDGRMLVRVLANGAFNIACQSPCYLSEQPNTNILFPIQGLGVTQDLVFSLGSPFRYVAFDTNEQLSSVITAQSANNSRSVTHVNSPTSVVTADLSQFSNHLRGNMQMSSAVSGSTVQMTLQSSRPDIIPPVFYNTTGGNCSVTGNGETVRFISTSVNNWCMDVRNRAITQPTAVTITLLATTTSGVMTYTSSKSFTIIVEPASVAPTPIPTTLAPIATPIGIQNLGQNVTINIATNTPTPTPTPTPTVVVTPRPPVVQSSFSVGITSPLLVVTPAPITLSLSVNTSTRRGTVSISNTLNTDLVINISSSNSRVVGVPATITIPRGSRSVSFNYTLNTASLRTLSTTIRITVSGGGDSTSSSFTVRR